MVNSLVKVKRYNDDEHNGKANEEIAKVRVHHAVGLLLPAQFNVYYRKGKVPFYFSTFTA
jgi:hypothetical protein